WGFGTQYPEFGGQYSLAGDYARSVITHNMGMYVKDSLGDLFTTWRTPAVFYALEGAAPDGTLPGHVRGVLHLPGINSYLNRGQRVGTSPVNEPLWVTALLDLSTMEQLAYVLLPLLLGLLGLWLWRRPRDVQAFLLLALLGAVLGTMAMAAFGNYAE